MFIIITLIAQSNSKTDNTVYYLQGDFPSVLEPYLYWQNKLDEIGRKESSPSTSSKDEFYYPSVIDNNNNLPYYFSL